MSASTTTAAAMERRRLHLQRLVLIVERRTPKRERRIRLDSALMAGRTSVFRLGKNMILITVKQTPLL